MVVAIAGSVAAMIVSAQIPSPPADAIPPPAGRMSHGAAGTARNGFGGSIAPSPTSASWPGTGPGNNGGPFAFSGAQYGSLWNLPTSANNSAGVGYCVMEDERGEGAVSQQADPPGWDVGETALAAAVMSTFGGDRVVPYGIDDSGPYDVATGEWAHPTLFGGGEFTRRRQVAVNFAVRMFLDDLSPTGVAGGRKLARDTAVVNGSGGEFSALRSGYVIAQYMAEVADVQHAVGGVSLEMVWGTPGGAPPDAPGRYPLEVRVVDSTGKRVGFVPVLQASAVGVDGHRSSAATAHVAIATDTPADRARWDAATEAGWPVWGMNGRLASDPRFAVGADPLTADVADRNGVARFDVEITAEAWELAFHVQAPTNDVDLYAGSGVQGQVTWVDAPQSASIQQRHVAPVGAFVVRKVLDVADVQGTRDMSGFSFDITDVATGAHLATVTTGADGRTPTIDAATGDYRVTEIGRPPWASPLTDPGPIIFHFDPATSGSAPGAVSTGEVVYTNLVPDAVVTTAASDSVDGDQYVSLWDDGRAVVGQIVDVVSYCGLVPGTEYRLDGELHVPPISPISPLPVAPSGVRGLTTFVPSDTCGTVDVNLEIPAEADLRGAVGVVFERLVVASTGTIVAEHVDPADAAQTISFPEIVTDMHRSGTDGAGASDHLVAPADHIVDVVTYSGLRAGDTYRADLTLHQRLADGTCTPIDVTASQDFTAVAGSGSVTVDVGVVPGPGVFVGFERIHSATAADPVAAHEDCDDPSQTVWAIGMVTSAAEAAVVGAGEMVDMITIEGLADGLPHGSTAVVEGFLHHHESADRSMWTCTEANRVGGFAGSVAVDGAHRSPGEHHETGWYSYDNRVVVTFLDASVWATDWHGCTVPAESFEAAVPPVAPTTIPNTTIPTVTIPTSTPTSPGPVPTSIAPEPLAPARRSPTALPRTGGTGQRSVMLLGAVMVITGAVLTRRARRTCATAPRASGRHQRDG
jgi:LPXTG-motif cell wall-anchored protein